MLILICFALLVCVLSALGLLVMKGFYNKLHYLAPPAILGTSAVFLAVLAQEGFNSSALKAALVLLVMVVTNPILTFAAARAKRLRDTQVGEEKETPPPGS